MKKDPEDKDSQFEFFVIGYFCTSQKTKYEPGLKIDFHSVKFPERTGNILFTKGNVALNLNRMSRVREFYCV